LYNYLSGYKEIFLPNVKEPNFFSEVHSHRKGDYIIPRPEEQYHDKIISSFDVYNSLYDGALNHQLKGDFSPSYLWDRNTARKLFNYNPQAKIIISLRHPVDRAYSHYKMNYYIGADKNKTFKRALKAPNNLIWGSCNQYLEMGKYYGQVKEYFDTFPLSQIKLIIYEDWIKDVNKQIEDLLEFLQISSFKVRENENIEYNKTAQLRNTYLLNFLRSGNKKYLIKKILGKKKLDRLKSVFFEKEGIAEKLDSETKNILFSDFKYDIQQLSELTSIDFNQKWNNR